MGNLQLKPAWLLRYRRYFQTTAGTAAICLLAFLSPSAEAEPANVPTGLRCDLLEHPEETIITTAVPEFDWIYHPSFQNDAQIGYRIIVASTEPAASSGAGDMWDSGLVKSANSINVPYAGKPLQTNFQQSFDDISLRQFH